MTVCQWTLTTLARRRARKVARKGQMQKERTKASLKAKGAGKDRVTRKARVHWRRVHGRFVGGEQGRYAKERWKRVQQVEYQPNPGGASSSYRSNRWWHYTRIICEGGSQTRKSLNDQKNWKSRSKQEVEKMRVAERGEEVELDEVLYNEKNTVKELQIACKERGLPYTGSKKRLLSRLVAFKVDIENKFQLSIANKLFKE